MYASMLITSDIKIILHHLLLSFQVSVLRKISHPNILTMIGACEEIRCIVYEYMHNGSLHDILFPSPTNKHSLSLSWHARIKVAADICSALGLLSSQPKPKVHGCLDTSHVLLDQNLIAKITGLRSSTCASPISDVVAVGLVILQLLTGNEHIGMQEVRLALESGTLTEILDQTGGDWALDLATEFARVGLRCSEQKIRDEGDVASMIGETVKEIKNLHTKAEGQMVHVGDNRTQLTVPDIFLCPIFQV